MSETSSNAIPAYLPLRNDLIGEEPYGAPQLDVPVCLNVNENPYAPEPAVVETIAQRVKEIALTLNRYPDREHIALRQAFCDYLERESGVKLEVDQLWGANGSNEIMLQLFQAFGGPGRIALGCDPTYSMYPEYARDTFTTWKLAQRNEDFSLNVDATIKAIEDVKPAMIVLTSPNNPTGTPLKMDDLKRVLGAAETAEVAGAAEGVHPVVVVDEAYIEFRDPGTPTALELIGEYENLAVSRTMSKAFAFAGARVAIWPPTRALSTVCASCVCRTTCRPSPRQPRLPRSNIPTNSSAVWRICVTPAIRPRHGSRNKPTRASRSKWPRRSPTSFCSAVISTIATASSTNCSSVVCSSAPSALTAGCAYAWAPTRKWRVSVKPWSKCCVLWNKTEHIRD